MSAADTYEKIEALLCEMQGLRDELMDVKRERDEAREEAERLRESLRCLLNPQCAVEEAAK